jgi:hypothetical protein
VKFVSKKCDIIIFLQLIMTTAVWLTVLLSVGFISLSAIFRKGVFGWGVFRIVSAALGSGVGGLFLRPKCKLILFRAFTRIYRTDYATFI